MAAILNFWLEPFYLFFFFFFIYKSPWCFLPCFKLTDHSFQEVKRKINFQEGGHDGHFGFQIGTILAIFDLQDTLMLPTKFQVNWPFGSGEEEKNRLSRWRPSWISDGNDFSYFWSTSHPDASYQVSSQLPFSSGEEEKNRFSRWQPWWPSWISDWNNFSYFDLQVTLMLPTKFCVNWPFGSGEEQKIDFQDGHHGGHLGFPIGMILALFDLQVIQMLPTKFQVNWPFGSREEAIDRFSRWSPWWPSWISNRDNFSYFWSTSHSNASYQVSSQLTHGCRRSRLLKQIVDTAQRKTEDGHWPITIAHLEHFVLTAQVS